jgi:DNA-directed RNA polymerase subunit RPC12/RpoP
VPATPSHVSGATSVGIVRCPGCTAAMTVMSREPVPDTDGLVDIVYRCEICGTETRRTVKDDR